MANRAQRRAQERHGPSSGLSGVPVTLARQQSGKSAGVVIGYPHPAGEVSARFHTSLLDLIVYDRDGATTPDGKRVGGNRHVMGHMPISSGANIVTARNKIVRAFLDNTWGFQANWLFFIDSDMTFNANALDMLLDTADPKERPIIGGLCFALMKGDAQEIVPTLYGMNTQGGSQPLSRYSGYPQNEVVQVVGTGAAFLLIHRSVLETIRDRRWTPEDETRFVAQAGQPSGRVEGQLLFPPPWPWFQETITGVNWGDSLSEDLTFCLRAGQCGFPIFVDTKIKTGHVKPVVIDEDEFVKGLPSDEGPAPTFVTIPVKGHNHFTKNLLKQLTEQGGYDHIFIYDNAAGTDDALPPMPQVVSDGWTEKRRFDLTNEGDKFWVDLDFKNITVFNAAGYRFHRMWNDGIRQSIARETRCNVVILNNDLELGPNFLRELTFGLRCHPQFASVSGNYDNRDFPEVVQGVRGVAAGREDGTGGWAGFGFAIRGEYLAGGLPMFDDEYHLWYGDNDFLMNIEKSGATYGIVKNAHMVHLGGGSNTSGDGTKRLSDEWVAKVEEDRKRFESKWMVNA